MKQLFASVCFMLGVGLATAQSTQAAVTVTHSPGQHGATVHTKTVRTAGNTVTVHTPTATIKSTPAGVKIKADGTPDRRYKANRHLKKNGKPDRRYKSHH